MGRIGRHEKILFQRQLVAKRQRPATTGVYPELVEGLPHTWRVHRGPRHARFWRAGVESTIGPAGLNLRRLGGVS